MGKLFDYPSYEEARRIVQENHIQSAKMYKSLYKELGLPAHPNMQYKDKGWTNWFDFLGKETISYPTYEEAKRIVQEKGIKGKIDYGSCYKELGLPSEPFELYKGKGWVSWYDFLGKTKRSVSYPPYEEAKRIVQQNGIKSTWIYRSKYKELGLPERPEKYYKDRGWKDLDDFFGRKKVSYPTYEEAQRIVQSKGIKTEKEYLSYNKELELPRVPSDYYKGKGWIDWYDFLGKARKVSPEEGKRRILSELFLSPTLLKDDELLQLIYIMAPNLDKEWVEEVQSLFGTTSFEKRLKWVKDQLNRLKEGGSVRPKKHSDEDIARESIIKVIEEVMGADKVQTLLENYYHSIVNRELIKEEDGE